LGPSGAWWRGSALNQDGPHPKGLLDGRGILPCAKRGSCLRPRALRPTAGVAAPTRGGLGRETGTWNKNRNTFGDPIRGSDRAGYGCLGYRVYGCWVGGPSRENSPLPDRRHQIRIWVPIWRQAAWGFAGFSKAVLAGVQARPHFDETWASRTPNPTPIPFDQMRLLKKWVPRSKGTGQPGMRGSRVRAGWGVSSLRLRRQQSTCRDSSRARKDGADGPVRAEAGVGR